MACEELIHTSLERSHGNIQRFEQNCANLSASTCKFALIPWSDKLTSVCEIVTDPLLHPKYCRCDRTVFDISSVQVGNYGLPLQLPSKQPSGNINISEIKFLDQCSKSVANAKLTVVFNSLESASFWNSQISTFEIVLCSVLSKNLFLVTQHCFIDVDGLNLHDIKYLVFHCNKLNGCLGRFVKNTKIVIQGVIDLQSYERLLSIKNYEIALGLSTPYEKLNELVKGSVEGKHNLNKIMVSGPSGCGKTVLVEQVCQRNNLGTVFVSGGTFAESKPGEAEKKMKAHFEAAKKLKRGAVIIDQIEAVCPKINDSTPSHSRRMVKQIASLLEQREFSSVLVIAVTDKPDRVDPSIVRAGRLDNEISIGPPSETERKVMLKSLLAPFIKETQCLDLLSLEGSKLTPGYILADLSLLSKKIGLRIIRKRKETTAMDLSNELRAVIAEMRPASLRGGLGVVTTEPMAMERIGGLNEIKTKLKILIEWPLTHPEAFQRMGIPRPKGVLLYGPPGCAKTSMVKAIASMTGKSFMAVSAAELYSSLVGESEKGIAALFRRARSAAPSVLFIDEIDALVGHRGHGEMQTGVQERVLATVLVEMDGLIASSTEGGVLVVAATNRPDLVDAALLRPGRFDHVIHVPAPDMESRKMILQAVTSGMAVASDVDFNYIAENTEHFSGADIQNLCQEAALHAMTTDGIDVPAVKNEHFVQVMKNAKPSLSVKWLEWYKNYRPGR